MAQSKRVLFVSRPIALPWDEASKNFVYVLCQHLKRYLPTILVNKPLIDVPQNVVQEPIYTRNQLSKRQKLLLLRLRKKQHDFDIIHFFFTPTKTNALFLRKLFRRASAKTVHTIATLNESYDKKLLQRVLWTDRLITYSAYAQKRLETMGFQNVTCIYPGIDLERYRPKKPKAEFLESFGISSKRFVISYPGEYTRLGATDFLVELLPKLAENIPELLFLFACRVKNEADKKKKALVCKRLTELGLSDRVLCTDTVTDMPSLYNASDVVIFPVLDMKGKFDVPLAIIEAMACARPVIISDLPVLQEFSSEQNAIPVEAGNAEHLHESIMKLYKDNGLCDALGKKARAYTEKHYDIQKIASRYEQLYDDVMEQPS